MLVSDTVMLGSDTCMCVGVFRYSGSECGCVRVRGCGCVSVCECLCVCL